MHNSSIKIISILVLSCIGIHFSEAQVTVIDINKTVTAKNPSKKHRTARMEEDEPLTLPFWDDFSWSRLVPDTTLWQKDSIGMVEISPTNGINPPTFNVASFDGIRLNGTPYSTSFGDFESGDTDILTSRPIDLSGLTSAEKNTVYLSFFYQKQGNGEQPDDQDGLRVEFLSITETDTTWQLAIPPSVIKGLEVTDTDWHQIIHQVTGEEYFHNIFQFRIISTGRQTGPYDIWNIDYVYLNKGRNDNDTTFVDRAFSVPISVPFENFTSLPVNHYISSSKLAQKIIKSRIHNLDSVSEVISGHFLGSVKYFDTSITDTVTFTAHNSILRADDLSLTQPPPYSSKDVLALDTLDLTQLNNTASYAEIKLKIFMNSRDNVPVDKGFAPDAFFINDTLETTYYLDDYYAYDDGTAEKGAGVNREGDNIAVQFPFLGAKTSFLKGVDMYIPQVVGEAQHGKQIKINIWSHGANGPSEIISARYLTVPKIETLNEFYRVEFSNPVVVTDTFYVGWEQSSSDRIFVGLDKNINSGDKIWLNTSNEWESNINQIEGSLMIRPYFEENATITSTDSFVDSTIKVYPNPSSRYFTIKAHTFNITVLNLSGQVIHPIIDLENDVVKLDFSSYPSGIYILKIIEDEQSLTQRILLNK